MACVFFRSAFTPYAKKNGGHYQFVVDLLKSVPVEQVPI